MGLDIIINFSKKNNDREDDYIWCPHNICRDWHVNKHLIRILINGTIKDVKQNISTFLSTAFTCDNTSSDNDLIGVMMIFNWILDNYEYNSDIIETN